MTKSSGNVRAKRITRRLPKRRIGDRPGTSKPLRFTIFRLGAKGYTAVRKSDGWAKSAVLGRSFRFVPDEELMGHRTYRLDVR